MVVPSPPATPRGTLWLLLTGAIVLTAVLWRPAHDSDLFWQLRTGDLILDAGHLPTHEPFLSDKGDEPFTPVAWAGQVILALLRRLGGWPLVHIVDGLLWTMALLAVGWSVRGKAWVVAVAIVFANYTMYSSVSTRPQTFGLLGFALFLALLRSELSLRSKLLVGTGILVVWQNLHPSATVGGLYLMVVLIVGSVRCLYWDGPTPWAALGLVCLGTLAFIATPAGPALLDVSARNGVISRWLEINEWMPLWELERRGDSRPEVWVGFVVSVGLLAWRGRRVRAEDLIAALAFAALGLYSYRFVMFWAVTMIPVWAVVLSCPLPPWGGGLGWGVSLAKERANLPSETTVTPHPNPPPQGGRGQSQIALTLFAFLVAIVVPTLRHPSHFADYVPYNAIDRLQAENLRGTVYTHTVWAGLVIDRGYPDWKVTHDGRYYLRSKEEWACYHAAAAGLVPVAELEARWQPVAFVLRTKFDDGLIELLRHDHGWRELPPEKDCVVFVRVR